MISERPLWVDCCPSRQAAIGYLLPAATVRFGSQVVLNDKRLSANFVVLQVVKASIGQQLMGELLSALAKFRVAGIGVLAAARKLASGTLLLRLP